MDQSKGEWRNMEMPNVSNKTVFELDMIIEVPGSLFIDVDVRVRVQLFIDVDVRVRVQFKHILCLVVHSFRGDLLTQPDSMILSFAYMVAAEQLKKKKKKTLPDQHVYVVAFLAW